MSKKPATFTSGNVIWAKSGGWNTDDYGFSVSADDGGNVYLTGGFTGSSITFNSDTITSPPFTTEPMFIIKLNSSGITLCADALSCAGDDYIGVSTDNFGNAYISGDYSANPYFIIGTDTLTSYGLAFIAKYNCPTTTGINVLSELENIHVYPNPFESQLTFILPEANTATFTLYDIQSQPILRKSFENSITIDTEKLSKGIYIYKIVNKDNSSMIGKVVKE